MALEEKIEILSVSLLDRYRSLVESIKQQSRLLRIELGWHYLLDIAWIQALLGSTAGKRILDAGAGEGVMQWMLAGQGAEVVSVDRTSRSLLPVRFRARYKVTGLRSTDLDPVIVAWANSFIRGGGIRNRLVSFIRETLDLSAFFTPRSDCGSVYIYNQDLGDLRDIENNSIDEVVAVSALEHNSPERLGYVVDELLRVLKPGGRLLATLGAAKLHDLYHEPSSGWCFHESTLRKAFHLPGPVPSNYNRYDELMQRLRSCAELRDSLAIFYSCSGNNGMPWGRWDPQYQPVGICKIK